MINLIGISGYMGSGKSTVGKIIRYLDAENKYPRQLKFCVDNNYSAIHSSWEIKGFATKLKEIASLLTGIPAYKFEDQAFKTTFLGDEWRVKMWPRMGQDGTPDMGHWHELPMTVREFLQKLGTEAIRNGLHENAWVNALFADYRPTHDGDLDEDFYHPNWIITDTRFENEAKAIKERGGIVVRVNRYVPLEMYHTGTDGKMVCDVSTSIMRHPSETSLDNWKFDYIIDNNDSMEGLVENVRKMLEHFKILEKNE